MHYLPALKVKRNMPWVYFYSTFVNCLHFFYSSASIFALLLGLVLIFVYCTKKFSLLTSEIKKKKIIFCSSSYSMHVSKKSNVGLVISHPDDEIMFFSATLYAFQQNSDIDVYVLCLSTGNRQIYI